MKKAVLTYGLIGGGLIMIFTFVIATLCRKEIISIERADLVGYAAMMIAASMIFFGIRSYRDNYTGGSITFWKGVQVGLLITCIASVMYIAGGELHNVLYPDFAPKVMEKFTESEMNRLRQEGASQGEIDQAVQQTADIKKMMDNPLFHVSLYLIELLPVGLIITILSAALLRRREVLPA